MKFSLEGEWLSQPARVVARSDRHPAENQRLFMSANIAEMGHRQGLCHAGKTLLQMREELLSLLFSGKIPFQSMTDKRRQL
jgi:hypothetical protein